MRPESLGTEGGIRRFLTRHRMVLLALGILFLSGGTLALATVLLATPRPVSGIPDAFAGLPLTHRLDGGDAAREIDRLHGKAIRVRGASIAHYEHSGTVVMLYVSDAYLGFLADRQLQAMVDGMKKRESPFAPPRAFQQGGQTIFWTLGQGQAHFFYRRGSNVIWLAADEGIAFRALTEMLRRLR